MKKVLKLIKDCQAFIIYFLPVILATLGILIKSVRIWLNNDITLKVWEIILILISIGIMQYITYYFWKKIMKKCKFKIGSEVMYQGYDRKMIVLKFNPLKEEVLCSWMESGRQMKKWFNQKVLEEYKTRKQIIYGKMKSRHSY